jgi:hypothetical protein
MADLPHFAYPFGRTDGKVNVVEQDTTEHIMACENVILHCPTGFRDDRPEFGWTWPEYRNRIDPGELVNAMTSFEPRSSASPQELTTRAQAALGEAEIKVEVQS